jgi:hypothetical protein
MQTKNGEIVNAIVGLVYDFFLESSDFNGIPLRDISEKLEISYKKSIDLIIEGVKNGDISVQSSTNPHIIGFQHFETAKQVWALDQAKKTKVKYQKFAGVTLAVEETDFPICLYPSPSYLKANRNLNQFGDAYYTKQLALGEPQLSLIYFDIEVLDRYANDPRYDFRFNNYSGSIYCHYDEVEKPLVREEEELFLKSFGLGYGENGERLAAVPLSYLKGLSEDQQMYWKSKKYNKRGKVAQAYYENIIMGNWTSSYSVFTAFIGEQNCLNLLSEQIFGKPLFRTVYDPDNRPQEFTPFFSPTLKNYLDFVSLLDKMISDNINKDFFKGKTDLEETIEGKDGKIEHKPKGTVRLFEDWLKAELKGSDPNGIKMLFDEFRDVRKQRQTPAHKITENSYDLKYYEMQLDLINRCYHATKALRHCFAGHPKAKNFTIPGWLDKGKIQNY